LTPDDVYIQKACQPTEQSRIAVIEMIGPELKPINHQRTAVNKHRKIRLIFIEGKALSSCQTPRDDPLGNQKRTLLMNIPFLPLRETATGM
jgi:hypothetical protein